jgi:hypothetical protein
VLSTIFDQVSKSVPRAVVYAGLLPVSVAVLLNVGLAAYLLGDGARIVVGGIINQSATAMAGWVTVGMVMLTIASTVVAALLPVFRNVLEGRAPTGILAALLDGARAQQVAATSKLRTDRERTRQQLAERVLFRAMEEERLKTARKNAPQRASPAAETIEALQAAITNALEDQTERGVSAAIDTLVRHFSTHGAGRTQVVYKLLLDRLDTLEDEPKAALAHMARAAAEMSPDGPVTRYGRELQYIETYVSSVYNIESIVFWTRLQHVIPTTFAARLEAAKSSLDLLTSLTMLLWCSLAAWMVVIPLAFPSWQVVAAVAVGGWSVTYVVYRAAIAAALSFAELVCAAFDLFRRDLLVKLSIQPPDTFREERQLWLRLGQLVLYRQVPDDLKLMPPAGIPLLTGTGVPVSSQSANIPIPTVTTPQVP